MLDGVTEDPLPEHVAVNRGWFRLFRETGFEVVDLIEIQAPEPGPEINFFVTAAWAHRFPSEQTWKLRKR
jgi:hypothetical protein